MTLLDAILLGLVQGITEFFPVSSSAHLQLMKRLLQLPEGGSMLYFDLLCHLGTLMALLIFLRHEVKKVIQSRIQLTAFFLALIPLIPAYFLCKPLRIAASDPRYLGFALMGTAALLFAASKVSSMRPLHRIGWRDHLCIGAAQTIALIPGISRSGSTIAMARFFGWDWLSAARFSFLLAIPTILGGELLESLNLLRGIGEVAPISFTLYMVGFFSSFCIGCLSVRFVFRIYELGIVRPFAWYCLTLGLLASIFREYG